MQPGRIRPLALCVIWRGDDLLVFEGHDRVKRSTFYRLLGGGIEFGEYGHQAVVRELREELGAELVDLRSVGTLENIFTFEGEMGHEIAQVYEARFADPTLYERDEMVAYEDDGTSLRVRWMPLAGLRAGQTPLYPEGLLALLDR
jgi:8-oxo-dGTP pyrophosphatase MutT (NUDIX family)